jgi:hypothetical protein
MSRSRKFLTLQDVPELLEEMDNECEAEIAISPPEGNEDITDEEEINDESLIDAIPSEVCGELMVTTEEKIIEETIIEVPLNKKSKLKNKRDFSKWKKIDSINEQMIYNDIKPINETNPELTSSTPFQLFLKMIPFEYLEELAQQTRLYALQKGFDFEVTHI